MLSLTVQKKIEPFKALALIMRAFPSIDVDCLQFTENDDGSTTIVLNKKVNGKIVRHNFNVSELAEARNLL